jgi:diguanylate cyclase (GGDEF)-like protein/PAS domain S-box-containing protein
MTPEQHQVPASTQSETLQDAPASQRWLVLVLPPLMACMVLGATALYWYRAHSESAEKQRANFHAAAEQIAYNLRDRMSTYEVMLRGVQGYVDGSERIERSEFQSYVDALQMQQTRPGLQGIALVMFVQGSGLPAHLADMRGRGFSGYGVHPPGGRAQYAPITHIEPLEGRNLEALGLDTLTLPVAREALERARDSGRLALSGLLGSLSPGAPPQGEVGLFLPVYSTLLEAESLSGRRRAIRGWVAAPFRVGEVVQGLSREFDPDIALAIYDGEDPAPAALLHGDAGLQEQALARGALQISRRLEVGGRTWTLLMAPLPAFDLRHEDQGHHMVAVMGAFLGLLLGWIAWELATGRERAVALARRMTAQLRGARDDLESTLNAIPDLLFELDGEGRIHHCRSARMPQSTLAPAQFVGQRLQDIVPPEEAAGCLHAVRAALANGYSAGHRYHLESDGQTRWYELSVARKEGHHAGEGARFVALARDITERQQAEARTHQLAYFDALTGLPNRRMLMDRLGLALAAARRSGQVGALVCVDLDNFKQINDARGHTLGDQLLVEVAQRLTRLLRPGDTVARLGGDEFVLLLQGIAADMATAGRQALAVAERVREALELPYAIDTHLYSSTGSLGITLFPKRAEQVEDLLREADTAMYRAKDLGRNRIRFYEAAMQADVQERLELEQDLKKAMAEGQLAVFVQAQVDARGEVVGGELLMRWSHPVRGSVPPSRFIPIAESSGLILPMGAWMIEKACDAIAQLQRQGMPLSISVNVSQRQFRQDDFVERVRNVLAQTGATPSCLILEVTESLLIENLDDTIARMTELVRLGVRFSIDDFGTGYSSLAYLKRLPLYELKIDKSFVQDTPGDPSDTAIVQSILSVARHLNLRVVAEGVETQAQADFLAASQCDCLQGYLFYRPEPLAGWLERLRRARAPGS